MINAMGKVKFKKSKFLTTLSLTVFATSSFFISPLSTEAKTISYSSPINYTVTTYEKTTSNLKYSPTTVLVDGRPYTYYTVTNSQGPAKKPLPSETENADKVKQGQTVQRKTIASGTKYATDLYIIDSGKPGPVVMIVGGVHGNETAGYSAAKKVKDYSIKKGTLLVIPQANKLAIEAGRRSASGESDLNRKFPQSSSASPKGTLAKAIYNVVKEYNVDWLMDMHEGFDYYKNSSTSSVGQTLIYYPANGARSTVEYIVNNLNKDISSSYRQFTLLRYPVKGSLARSTAQYLGVNSFIFETSKKQTLSTRINLQEKAAKTLLSKLGML